MIPKFLKSLDADDIFISYSRADGEAYLTGLDAALSKLGFSCFSDKRGTDADRLPPEALFQKDGQVLAVLYRHDINFVRVWDVDRGLDVTPESLISRDAIESGDFANVPDLKLMALSPGGHFLATTDKRNQTHLVNLTKGQVVNLLDDTVIGEMAFSPNERYLGLGSDEGLLHVFETARPGDEIARLQHTGKVTAIAFSEDDKYVATASSDSHPYRLDEEESYPLRVWLLQPKDMLAEATARLDRLLKNAP